MARQPIYIFMNTALHTAGLIQTQAYRILQHRLNSCLQTHGLNQGQWTMLGVVADAKSGIRLNTTAQILGVKAPLITAMANELIERGFLDRCCHEHDKRAKQLTVTPAGAQLLETVRVNLSAMLCNLLDGLSRQELAAYRKVLETIISNNQQMSKQ